MWWAGLFAGWVLFGLWVVGAVPAVLSLRRRALDRVLPPSETTLCRDRPLWRSVAGSDVGERDGARSLQNGTVTVIVPARDEAATIEQTLCSLLASTGIGLEIVAVDDRSCDETGRIMDRMADDDSRLRVLHVSDLPAGWLGKNHAMHAGAQQATGKWLLFTDGDILFAPDTISLAVQHAEADALDHLCLVPRMESGGYWETALTSFFGLIFSMGTQPWLVPTSIRRAYVGVGAFNMVRREAYEQFGGHGPIRLDVLDDVKLGKLVKRSGFRSNLLVAGDRLRVRWQPSAWGVIRGLEKNAFASQDYSVRKLVGSTLIFVTLFVLPYVGALAFDDARRWGFAAAALVAHFNYGWISSMFGGGRRGRFAATGGRKPALPDACGGWRVLPVLPLAALAILFAFWRSAVITLRQGGVRWRDTFYPLDLLRRNLYR